MINEFFKGLTMGQSCVYKINEHYLLIIYVLMFACACECMCVYVGVKIRGRILKNGQSDLVTRYLL